MTMQTVVREINTEYDTSLDEIKSDTAYDVLEMSGSRAVSVSYTHLVTKKSRKAKRSKEVKNAENS